MSPIGCERKKPPEEKFSHNFAARGRVAKPMRRRQTLHQKHKAVSFAPIVQRPSMPAMPKGIRINKKRRGEDPLSEVWCFLMTELLQ